MGSVASGRWWVPGRVELFGKHTDYCGGMSLTVAVDMGFTATWRALDEPVMRCTLDGSASFPLREAGDHAPGWANYVQTVARRATRDLKLERGVEIELVSTLEPEAGLSSSSALGIAALLPLLEANGRLEDWADRASLADYAAAVESGKAWGPFPPDFGVGTSGGSEDHTAILNSHPGHAGLWQYVPTRHVRWARWPQGWNLYVAHSGVAAPKTGRARLLYNRVAELAYEAAGALGVAVLDSAQPPYAGLSSEHLTRVRHFEQESRHITPAAAEALERADARMLGDLAAESTRLADQMLRNQVPETLALVRLAREAGALAASPFGAGFGGSVWAIAQEPSFLQAWKDAFPGGKFFAVGVAGPARPLEPEG